MDRADVEEVRTRTDIVELINGYTALKRAGAKFKGLCPFHQERTPSFNVDPALGRWHCFGSCGTGGDCFNFLMRAENITFPEALQKLAARAGITLAPRGDTPEERAASQRSQSDKDRAFAANAAAQRFFRDRFRRDKDAQQYAAKRGLVHETLENFQIGWAPDDWTQLGDFLRRDKVPAGDAELAGLILASKRNDGTYTDRFRGRLMFPILDVQERIVGFGGRLIAPKEGAPKYLNTSDSPVFSKSKVLYGLNRARKALGNARSGRDGESRLLVVEGYMDVVAAHQAGIENVVATLGTAMTEDHVRMIRQYGVTDVVLSFDADDAGVKAALRAADLIGSGGSGLSLRVLSLPPGEDPDSLLQKGEAARFRRAIDDALTVAEFRLSALETRTGSDSGSQTDASRAAMLREAVTIIAALPDALERDRLIRRMARFHPTYATGSLRAEESLRSEVLRASGNAGGFVDDGFGAPPPPPRRNGYRNNGGGGGGGQWNGRNSGGKDWGAPQWPLVAPDPAHVRTPLTRSAAEEAERTLLRALLSDEWSPILLRLLDSHPLPGFVRLENAGLAAALWPCIVGDGGAKAGMSPSDAIRALSQPALADYAATLRMDDAGPELSEPVIADALRQAKTTDQEREQEQFRVVEGNAALSDEQLRQWAKRARTLRGGAFDETDSSDDSSGSNFSGY